jgi:CheY-like chemotaxis protein
MDRLWDRQDRHPQNSNAHARLFEVINLLRREAYTKPLIVYTAADLSEQDRTQLQLGKTAHFTKSTTSQDQLLNTAEDFLNGLLLSKAEKQ